MKPKSQYPISNHVFKQTYVTDSFQTAQKLVTIIIFSHIIGFAQNEILFYVVNSYLQSTPRKDGIIFSPKLFVGAHLSERYI
jgi:hypothetical protein